MSNDPNIYINQDSNTLDTRKSIQGSNITWFRAKKEEKITILYFRQFFLIFQHCHLLSVNVLFYVSKKVYFNSKVYK